MPEVTLSVVLGVYNKELYLAEALESLLMQSRQPDEIIIVDDASTDGSLQILEKYSEHHTHIKLYRHERNMGAVATYNHAINISNGTHLYLMGADDLIRHDFFALGMKLAAIFPAAGLVTSDPSYLDEDSGQIRDYKNNFGYAPCFLDPANVAELLDCGHIASHGTLIKKNCLLSVGCHHSALKWHSDWFFLLAIAFRYGICSLPGNYGILRVVKHSYTNSMVKTDEQKRVIKAVIELLQTPQFIDLLPHFIRSKAFSIFGNDALQVVKESSEMWNAENLLLVMELLFAEWRRLNQTPVA